MTTALTAFHPSAFRRKGGDKPTTPSVSRRIAPHAGALSASYTLSEESATTRGAVEQFIQNCFATTYGAQVQHFMPRLFSLRDQAGEIVGGFGLRSASQPLFLERYLDCSIETAMSKVLGQSVQRGQIVEVGQFAGMGAGVARSLIAQLTAYLHHHGYRWVAFTGTAALRNAFHRLGLNPQELAPADPLCLAAQEREHWGGYYQHGPKVLFGNIAEGLSSLIKGVPAAIEEGARL